MIKADSEISPSVKDDVAYGIIDEESEEDKIRDTDDEEQKDAEVEILDCEESISDGTENENDKFQIASTELFTITYADGSTKRYTPSDGEEESIANCSLDRISPHPERIPNSIRRYKSISDLSTYNNLKQF